MANDDRQGWWRRRAGDGSRRRSCLDDQMPVLLIESLRAIGLSGGVRDAGSPAGFAGLPAVISVRETSLPSTT